MLTSASASTIYRLNSPMRIDKQIPIGIKE